MLTIDRCALPPDTLLPWCAQVLALRDFERAPTECSIVFTGGGHAWEGIPLHRRDPNRPRLVLPGDEG